MRGQGNRNDDEVEEVEQLVKQGFHRVTKLLESIEKKIDASHAQGRKIIMALQEIQDVLARIDTATNAIAAKIAALVEQIGTGMSAADVATVTEGLTAEAVKLEGIAADPANPVP